MGAYKPKRQRRKAAKRARANAKKAAAVQMVARWAKGK